MVIPLIPAILMGTMIADALVGAYATYDNTKQSNRVLDASATYIGQSFQENERYWADYFKNTGRRPLYPYRAGAVNDISQLYNIDYARTMNKNSIIQSGSNIGSAGAFGYGMYDSKNYHNRRKR